MRVHGEVRGLSLCFCLVALGLAMMTPVAARADSDRDDEPHPDPKVTAPAPRDMDSAADPSGTRSDAYGFERDESEEVHRLPPNRFQAKGGAIFFSDHHSYQVETHAESPVFRADDLDGLLFIYEHRDVTPFVDTNGPSQVEELELMDNLRTELKIDDELAFLGLLGYQHTYKVDLPGARAGYQIGVGVGTPYEHELEDLNWRVLIGALAESDNMRSNWFADAEVTYRVVDLPFGSGGLHNELRPSLLLELEEESTNDGAHRAGYYVEGGPTIEMMSMNGNRFSVFFHGVKNSGDEFRMSNDEGVFAGVKATTFQDTPQPNHYDWDFEGARWIPRMRAVNELCGSFDGSLNKIEFRLDAFEWKTFDQIWTVYTDYEHRQNWLSNFDNTSYSVNPGLKTYIEPNEWLAVLTDGQHLVPFVEYSHRSDHALDPKDPLRFTSANTTGHGYLRRQSIDNFQGGFQTLGWNNPNYRAEKYQKVSSFVNQFDWRLTAGYAVNEPRQRDQPPASAGLNWDIASIEGFVVYAQGIVGIGEANPDYIAELGVKRPGGNVFLRYESYGLPARLEGRQHPLYAGIGMQL